MNARSIVVGLVLVALFEQNSLAIDWSDAGARDVTLATYRPYSTSLVTQVHAGRIFTDYERHGFFRIGLLPLLVVENIQIQINSASSLTNTLSMLGDWNKPTAGVKRLELRNLEITSLDGKTPLLRAANARMGKDGALELSNASVFSADGQPITIPKATLQISGALAGRLRWNRGGRANEFFILEPIN